MTVNPSRRRRVPPVHEATGGHAVNTLMSLLQRKNVHATMNKRQYLYGFTDKKYTLWPVEGRNMVRRPRFSGESAPDGILKMPTAAKMQENRARWTLKMPSTGREFTKNLHRPRRIQAKHSDARQCFARRRFAVGRSCCCQLPAGSDSLCRASYRYEAPPQRAMVMACDSWERVANTMPCSNGIPYIADRASETI